jgi:hypothetical protein
MVPKHYFVFNMVNEKGFNDYLGTLGSHGVDSEANQYFIMTSNDLILNAKKKREFHLFQKTLKSYELGSREKEWHFMVPISVAVLYEEKKI